ncbi:hypothetical protein POM88_024050 [Heracleum sosnowskyi]|uniref:Zinc finger PMZ-type domain-containing protein n=1 Tax=Heracleum sosnowskyi TaxID=360622 RepID=A0AAD8IIF1_9APIA|nr:hypothetical protein POM88_024050 [Heracleum sosnowskyi]
MWVAYIESTQSWQVKTITDDHNCVWSYQNRLVSVKWLADKYGDKIRKNPNWKLGEIQEEFKKELNRDAMARRNCIIVPRQKQILDEAIKASAGMRALWNGREKYVVKGNGSSCEVSLKHRSCSYRVWYLTGMPCSHAVTAIQESRQHPVEFVAHWFTKQTYMKTYSNYIEVIRGEEFWDDVLGDTILPPVIVKKLKGGPKKQRKKKRWEGGSVSHDKRGRPKKAQVIEPDETEIEVELHVQTKAGMKFMPTPGTRKSRGHVTGCTPYASTAPTATSQNQKTREKGSKYQNQVNFPIHRQGLQVGVYQGK